MGQKLTVLKRNSYRADLKILFEKWRKCPIVGQK